MRISLLICLLLLSVLSFGQTQSEMEEIEKENFYRGFKLVEKGDTIRFFVVSKPGEEQIKKPLILYRQGSSLPIPIFTRYPEGVSINAIPSQFPDFLNKYHIVVLAKPGVPLIFNASEVSNYFDKVVNQRLASKNYIENNHLDYYVIDG